MSNPKISRSVWLGIAATAVTLSCLLCFATGGVVVFFWNQSKSMALTPGKHLEVEGVRIQLLSGSTGKPMMRDLLNPAKPDSELPMRMCQLKFRITNQSKTRIINYRAWSSNIGEDFISDDFGNRYAHASNMDIFFRPVGSVGAGSRIDPERSVDDVLLFDCPIGGAKEITFTLPTDNLGISGGRSIIAKVPRSFFN